jgi:autotransporter-associated beta strand protein
MQNALTGKINLNGCDQTVAGLRRNESYASTIVVTSAVPATLTVNLNTAMAYDGQLDGALSLVKAGTGTLTLSNALSCTRGSIAVSNGTLVVTAASVLGNSTNVTVAAPVAGTSMLTLQTSAGIANAAALRIANGGAAKVSLAAGVNETVGWLYFGDKMMRAGTYSAASAQVIDTEHFAGTGVLTVLHDKSGTLIKLN